ncbi:hypothetical protein Aduo_009673 [Ancylostoma duodenale]
MALECAIRKNVDRLSEAELGIARCLGREASFAGLRSAETFLDEVEFNSESSSDEEQPKKKRKRSTPTDKEISRLQLEILKEEKALIAKKSILLDKQIAFYDAALKKIVGEPIVADSGQCQMWSPLEGDPIWQCPPTLNRLLIISL